MFYKYFLNNSRLQLKFEQKQIKIKPFFKPLIYSNIHFLSQFYFWIIARKISHLDPNQNTCNVFALIEKTAKYPCKKNYFYLSER